MEFHVEYSRELPWNMTVLHGVFIRFRPSGIAMENVSMETAGFHVMKYFMEFP